MLNDNAGIYDDRFRAEMLSNKSHLERGMLEPLYVSDIDLNKPITAEEVKKAVTRTKNGKAMGTDNIPNEVLN